MKVFLIVSAFLIAAILTFVEVDSMRMPLILTGLYLFASACLISAALWKSAEKNADYDQYAYRIFSALSGEEMSLNSLLEKITEDTDGDIAEAFAKRVMVRMLEAGSLAVVDGKVCLRSNT